MDEVECAPSSALESAETLALFLSWGKVRKKKVENAPAERPEALWNPVLGGNLEDLHGDANQELDSVLGGTLMIWNVKGLLDVKKDCWHFHQLLHQLRIAKRDSHVLENDLGHIDNLLGDNRAETWQRTGGRPATVPPSAAQEHRALAHARMPR